MKEDPRRNEVEDFQNAKPSQLSYIAYVVQPKKLRENCVEMASQRDRFRKYTIMLSVFSPIENPEPNQRPRLSIHDSDEDILPWG